MYNKAILIGRLVADPEMRTTSNGINVASLRIAVDRAYAKGAERKTDFINVVCWRNQAEFVCRYFSKGRQIGVDGAIQTRDYVDKEGNKRNTFEIVADRVFFVESKGGGGASSSQEDPFEHPMSDAPAVYASGSADDFTAIEGDDDLPF